MLDDLDTHWSKYYNQDKDFAVLDKTTIDKIVSSVSSVKISNRSCLDIGCGTGQLSREFSKRGFLVCGIDVSTTAINKAQLRADKNKGQQYLLFDIEKDETSKLHYQPYSLVVCKYVYAFINDKPKFLSRISTLLIPGGVFIIISQIKSDLPKDRQAIGIDHGKTLDELKNKFLSVESFKYNDTYIFIAKS
jgi:2-polyprenyl-3-methyl-5-hydroxy-6-metoxy-1,4-benzoquinol methylase